ncbi:hypothetical protein FCIRC_3331 [Fusarium circinatum]|uniref:Uncharacterized protein n=1 Tax=Fusarium circinatum TaxID=48490 RepID=A0A8H5X7V9_FUSCI|nr:hypothetical protein FCIRC_3331 [Fusarium circinatum]
MKATLFVSLLLSLGVTATPATDTVTIEDGGYTYTGIDKVCKLPSPQSSQSCADKVSRSPFSPSVVLRLVAAASPATLPTRTVSPESASALVTMAAGLVAAVACSASLVLDLDSAGPKHSAVLNEVEQGCIGPLLGSDHPARAYSVVYNPIW